MRSTPNGARKTALLHRLPHRHPSSLWNRCHIAFHRFQKRPGLAFVEQYPPIHLSKKAFFHYHIQKRRESIVKTFAVQQRARLRMMTEFSPSPDFECLPERSNASRQSNESLGKLRHQRLAFVHRCRDAKLAESLVSQFPLRHELRHHPNYFTARFENGIGNGPHQTNRSTAVHQSDTLGGHMFSK